MPRWIKINITKITDQCNDKLPRLGGLFVFMFVRAQTGKFERKTEISSANQIIRAQTQNIERKSNNSSINTEYLV